MALVRCILGKFLGVVCHSFPRRLDVPTFATRCLQVRHDGRDSSGGRWNCGREILPKWRLPRHLGGLLHAANLRNGTDGFTSPPKEGVLRISSPSKIRRLRPGLNPWTWVLKASMLSLDHRSRFRVLYQLGKHSTQLNIYVNRDYKAFCPASTFAGNWDLILKLTHFIILKNKQIHPRIYHEGPDRESTGIAVLLS